MFGLFGELTLTPFLFIQKHVKLVLLHMVSSLPTIKYYVRHKERVTNSYNCRAIIDLCWKNCLILCFDFYTTNEEIPTTSKPKTLFTQLNDTNSDGYRLLDFFSKL